MPWTTTRPSLLQRLHDPRDEAAWRDFDRRYGELVFRYARRRGLSSQDAEDVRQTVFVSLMRALPGFEYDPARGRFRSYLGRVVFNAVSRVATRPARSRELLLEDIAELPVAAEAPADSQWEREWADHHLRTALRRVRHSVDPRSLRVFDRLLAGAATNDVAAEFGLTDSGVRKIRSRIRARLQEFVQEQIRAEDA